MKNLRKIARDFLSALKDFFEFAPYAIVSLYSSAFDSAGLNTEDMKQSIIGYSLGAIVIGGGVTICILGILGLAIISLVFGAYALFKASLYIWPVYVVFVGICFWRWYYIKKHYKK